MKKHKLTQNKSIIFIGGAPLTGKTTIGTEVAARIDGLTLLPMDIVRIFSQILEKQKPKSTQNKFVNYGSCDSYIIVNDGKRTNQNIIDGYKMYSQAVFEPLKEIISKLEVQGCEHLVIEGVQLTPKLVAPYLGKNAKLIIITASNNRLASNKNKIFGSDKVLNSRYSNNNLTLIQSTLLEQTNSLNPNNYLVIQNTGTITECSNKIIKFLIRTKFIE